MIWQHRTIPERNKNFDLLSQQNSMVKLMYFYLQKTVFTLLWINLTWNQAIAEFYYNLVFQKHPAPFNDSFFLTPT